MLGSYVRFRDNSLYPDDFFEVKAVNSDINMVFLSDIDMWVDESAIVIDKDVKIFISKRVDGNSEPLILNDIFNSPLIFENKEDAFDYMSESNSNITSLSDFFNLKLSFLPIKLIAMNK